MASADELFYAAFNKERQRTPRSLAYKAGVLALLRRQIEGTPFRCQWDEGTAGFDAFYAGVEEGWQIIAKEGRSQIIAKQGRSLTTK